MTIGEKILKKRTEMNLTQEGLAELIDVSRQSVSKWEMDQAVPGIDKISMLCKLFGMKSDELIFSEAQEKEDGFLDKKKSKYFGTDGFRGEANIGLTSQDAYKVGRFLGWYYSSEISGTERSKHRPRIVIGKDTRRSSYMLEYSIAAGLSASGADVYMLHVTTTPSVSYVTREDSFDAGIMITASHNPYYDNGIKVINRYGEKLDEATTDLIEEYLDGNLSALGITGSDIPFAKREKIGLIVDYVSGRNRYIGYLISLASHSYKNLKIGIDCANGASWSIARGVFGALGAKVVSIGCEPDGLNVNSGCGSTSPEAISRLVREGHLDIGFAFDGDADRCIAVDEYGNIVDGDKIMYILARRLKSRGMLKDDTVVATVMSNSALENALEREGMHLALTKVGDKFVYDCMQENDYSLGGEQSGHIIIKKYATTGDGLLTAIMLLEELLDSKSTLSKLASPIKPYPQLIKNIKVKSKSAVMADKAVLSEVEKVKTDIGGSGRALLRESGTEPVIRIMIECEREERCEEYAERIAEAVRAGGHCL